MPPAPRRTVGWYALGFLLLLLAVAGCHDGPLYALKTVNPYFFAKEWREDTAYGVTDHQRRQELTDLAGSIGRLPAERQAYWLEHLGQILEHDPSAEMRRIAVLAAGNAEQEGAQAVIEKGLEDESFKVRMEACRALGKRTDETAANRLAAVVGTDTHPDVKHAAITALGNHDSEVARGSLRLALTERNPATQGLAIDALRKSMGKDFGNDPQVWIAALDGEPVEESRPSFSDRLGDWF